MSWVGRDSNSDGKGLGSCDRQHLVNVYGIICVPGPQKTKGMHGEADKGAQAESMPPTVM